MAEDIRMKYRVVYDDSSLLGSYSVQQKSGWFWGRIGLCTSLEEAVKLIEWLKRKPKDGAVLYEG